MTRAADWTVEEFEILLQNNALSAESLCRLLPRRTVGAIDAVRAGIHDFHRNGESTLLSRVLKDRLYRAGGPLTCPLCGERADSA